MSTTLIRIGTAPPNLEAGLHHASTFKDCIDAMRRFFGTTTLVFTSQGMSARAMNHGETVGIALNFDRSSFTHYRCGRKVKIGMNLVSLSKALQCVREEDALTLSALEEPDSLNLLISGLADGRVCSYDVNAIDIDQDSYDIPPHDYDAEVVIPSKTLLRIVGDLHANFETVSISCVANFMRFTCSSDIGDCAISLRSSYLADDPADVVETIIRKPLQQRFDLHHLNNLNLVGALTPKVKLYLDPDMPLMVEYKLDGGSLMRLHFAPMESVA